MNDLDIQTEYWDNAAASKTFTSPCSMADLPQFASANLQDFRLRMWLWPHMFRVNQCRLS